MTTPSTTPRSPSPAAPGPAAPPPAHRVPAGGPAPVPPAPLRTPGTTPAVPTTAARMATPRSVPIGGAPAGPPGAPGAPGTPSIAVADALFLRELVQDRSAIVLDTTKEYLLVTRLEPIMRAERIATMAGLVEALRKAPRGRLESMVIDAMTTNETSFFRDVHPFHAFADVLVPEILQKSQTLSVWCAAASSGQEPYTVILSLIDKYPDLMKGGRFRMVATDLSPSMISRVKEGRYTQLEVNRGLPAKYLTRFFTQQGQDWVVKQELRSLIESRTLNLVENWPSMPRCDVVFLRNVLIYFAPDVKRKILERIRRDILKPGGFLFLGSSETTLNIDSAYVRREVGRTFVYQTPDRLA